MSQLSYGYDMGPSFPGMLAEAMNDHVESYAAETAIAFGQGVIFGTDPAKQVDVPAAASDKVAGVALHVHKELGAANFEAKETVPVLRKGKVWVQVTAEVTAGDAAHIDILTAGKIGRFTNVATNNLAVPTGVFRTGAAADGLAVLEINLP